MSETATARPLLAHWCKGPNGLDIGAGGDPIVPHAICIDRAEDSGARAHVGQHPTHLVGDAASLHWFADNTMDWIYSSHCLEDFENTTQVLLEWGRVLVPGGHLILFLPDQRTYVAHCEARNASPNQAHKHDEFGLEWIRLRMPSWLREIEAIWPFPGNPYSFSIVCEKDASLIKS